MSNAGYFTQKIMRLSNGDPACPTGSVGNSDFPQSDICASSKLAEIQLKISPHLRSPNVGHAHCDMDLSKQMSTANRSRRPIDRPNLAERVLPNRNHPIP